MKMKIFTGWTRLIFAGMLAMYAGVAVAGDEAELKVWTFKTQGDSLAGNGPLKHALWPVRDKAMRMEAKDKLDPSFSIREINFVAEKANVVQIRANAASAKKIKFWFATGVSPKINAKKMVEFDVKPGAGVQDYTLDMKGVATWTERIAMLRFDFVGAKPGDEISVEWVKVFEGGKISKPMLYAPYRLGEKHVPREFHLAAIFNDGMVLQRDCPVPIWGVGKAGETVTVAFAGQKKSAAADAAGKWKVTLDPLKVSGEPAEMVVSSSIPAHNMKLSGIVVGDVWVCSGQSNMGGTPIENAPPAERRKELLETAYPNLRYTAMPGQNWEIPFANDAAEDPMQWNSVDISRVAGVSAVSYYFGQALHASQKIPVGLLLSIKAGSQVEQWMSEETLKSLYTPDEMAQLFGKTKHLASGLYNGMIAPIPPFPVCGVVWYQGESNADNEARCAFYHRSLPGMIRNWRSALGREAAFMLVQLPSNNAAGYKPESWSMIREVQWLAAQHLPKVGMAVTFDEGDPANLHPTNKYFVGTRLALAARAQVYGEKIEYSGPVFQGFEKEGNALSLRFDHVGGGLKARGELTGFEVRGEKGEWSAATATIVGKDRVKLSSAAVAAPAAVRYAWANAPKASLFNDLDLPAGPFRSDTPAAQVAALKAAYAGKGGPAK